MRLGLWLGRLCLLEVAILEVPDDDTPELVELSSDGGFAFGFNPQDETEERTDDDE